jgi:uncharacterized RDD family membrane protein YckC
MKNQKLLTAVVIIIGSHFLWQLYNVGLSVYIGYFDLFFLLRYLPSFIGIAGLILFATSKFKKSSLLRFYMGLVVFSYPFNMALFISYFTRENEFSSSGASLHLIQYVWLVIGFIFTAACTVGLWILSKSRVAKLTYHNIGGELFPEFTPSAAGTRFLNRLIDSLVYVYMAFIYIKDGLFGVVIREADSLAFLSLIEIPFIILYYIFFESIFQCTPGKCLTNTIVVNESGGRPRFVQILGRTFSRLIPFEALTFFGSNARGWHDSLPNTYVVEAANSSENQQHEFLLDAEAELYNRKA